jgi:hypothetical protein
VVAVVALFIALGGGAYAVAIRGVTDEQGVIQACYDKKGRDRGEVRLLVKGKCKRKAEKPIAWNQQGPAGPQGPQGPGAVKLHFDRPNDNQVVTLGTVGPWTIKAQCASGGVSVPAAARLLIDGPGFADVGYTSQLDGDTPSAGFSHNDLGTDNQVFSFGVLAPDVYRVVGTIVLTADAASPVVSVPFSLVLDEGNKRCSFVGTATPAA